VRHHRAVWTGGPTDVFAGSPRKKLSEQLGKAVLCGEHRRWRRQCPGTGQAARAAPDGLIRPFHVSACVTNPAFVAKAPYDPVKDFAPVVLPVASASRSWFTPWCGKNPEGTWLS